ncbi:class I SAM-dependent methyltransferase [Thermoflavimicrobium dichotomicum]|uniref:Putative rRNA methylase n=1 Tax=Thermoflavimicrobium dichotomicum TaxID=46223 RepID=A0A1I3RNL8_9BACL|nr:class I SAM-dependent methyltransferase [Thermoflavimicrobium dichotomicum]SFJ46796.1 Putative rRNA methylase [Thermoflavimicrobium dichotomicum]
MLIPSTLASARHYITSHLKQVDPAHDPVVVMDATIGNGHDTLFLAEIVHPQGKVYGFDIQPEAISTTTKRLEQANLLDVVELHLLGHERFDEVIPADLCGKLEAVMFNLGYLPHGNPSIITRPDTTITALDKLSEWLAPGGVITLALYTGHPGGQEEADAVVKWASSLPAKSFQVMWQQILNRHHAPSLVVVEKR